MDHYYVRLQNIRAKPMLWLGTKSIDSVYWHWLGYSDRALYENSAYTGCLDGFQEFVYAYYCIDQTAHNWHSLIVSKTESQEAAFDKFFELFDAFMKTKQ
jgi:hypothetical protein